MKKKYILLLGFWGIVQLGFSQIKVDDATYTAEELVKDILINSPCAKVENITSSTGTATGNNGIGYFTKESSNFPLASGVILSSGKASSAEGPNSESGNPTLNDGEAGADGIITWKGDVDLENAIGLAANSTNNATILEFDFIPTANFISFRFLLASEEYLDAFPCQFSDSFAFLLRPADGSAPYENLAVIPGTNTPISVVNIHNTVAGPGGCAAKNAQYFDQLNTGTNATDSAINFNGQTKVFTASSSVVPNQRYHIKLVIADFLDGSLDSAVFLEAGSFDIGGSLGDDRTVASGNPGCDGAPVTLDSDIGSGATYQWFKDGVEITGATNATYDVTVNGEYSVNVNLVGTCTSMLGPVKVEFTDTPSIAAAPVAIVRCENDTDGIEQFDFSSNTSLILGTQDSDSYVISYHKTQNDADDHTNALTLPYSNIAQNETIYARIADKTQTCFLTATFNISVEKQPVANAVTAFEMCDDDTDGITAFDLLLKVPEILGAQSATDFEVKFYDSQTAADAAVTGTDITGLYMNTANPQAIIARIENKANTNCFATVPMQLVVNPLPVITDRVELKQCDNDTDGISIFNLNEANQLISANHADEVFTYFISRPDAMGNTNAIADPMAYTNPDPLNSRVFARVQTNKGCTRIAEVDLVVGATQIPATFMLSYELCDDQLVDNDDTNGVATFDFDDATAQIKALFPAGQMISVTYYENEADALSEFNPINDPGNHRNDTSPNLQNIYVRVDSDAVNACLGLGNHIELIVKPLPKTQTLTPFEKCSDSNVATFDLNTKTAEVIGSQTENIIVSYHTSLTDATEDKNALGANYQNTSSPQTIYVRAQFDTNTNGVKDIGECFSTAMKFDLVVNPNPVLVQSSLGNCSETVASTYDLTMAKTALTQGNDGIELTFFESEMAYANNTPITTPNTYVNDVLERTLVVVGENSYGCTTRTTLHLTTVLYLNINKNLDAIEECETDNDGIDRFDLTASEIQLLNGIDPNTVLISYHEKEAEAIAGNGAITTPKNYTNTIARAQTIYVRVQPKDNDCYQIVPLELAVRPLPPY